MDTGTIVIIIAVIIILLLYVLYARIIKNKNKAYEALAGIDVQLKNRSNLIPNILLIAKKFMEHEKNAAYYNEWFPTRSTKQIKEKIMYSLD